MTAAMDKQDLAPLMQAVADRLLGKPTQKRGQELRWGRQGSLSIDLKKGTFFDHEACEGGGVIDLIRRENGGTVADALTWLESQGLREAKPNVIDRSLRGFWVCSDGTDVRNISEPAQSHGVNLKPGQSIVATFNYFDAQGALLYRSHRIEPGDNGANKTFRQDRPNGKGGWAPNAGSVKAPYRLPELLASNGPVYLAEGEAKADRLASWGLPATSLKNWNDDFSQFIAGREAIILPDNDGPGEKQANKARQSLEAAGSVVHTITLPGLPDKGDILDWDGNADDLAELIAKDAQIKPTLPFVWFDDARPNLDANDFVEGLLTSGSMSVVYGPSNCGKTFFVIDLALHVAWGKEWRGKEVDQGAIVYLSLEGAQGIQNRMRAFKMHHDCGALPFVAMPRPVNLLNEKADVDAVIQLVKFIASETGLPVRMVIVDTLSRAMAGGNENSSEDMTALIGNCDRVRDATGAHVCIVHHSGKDEAKGARGHSSLRAATDTEIEIKRDPELTRSVVKVVKQRDLEADDPLAFTLQSINLGTNRRGKPVTSCVVLEAEETMIVGRGGKLSPKEKDAWDVLLDMFEQAKIDPETGEIANVPPPVSVAVWKEKLEQGGTLGGNTEETRKVQFRRLRNALRTKLNLQFHNGYVRQGEQGGT